MQMLPSRTDTNFTTPLQLSGKKFDAVNPSGASAFMPRDATVLATNLEAGGNYDKAQLENMVPRMNEITQQGPSAAPPISVAFENTPEFQKGITSLKNQQNVKNPIPLGQTSFNKSRTIKAQSEQIEQGPLSVGRYESISQLRDDLIAMGPRPETYERIMGMVGQENEDDAKDALASFFQGMASSLPLLYDMLVSAGMANPIDAEIVEKLMSQHPNVFDDQGEQKSAKVTGLFIPVLDSGMNTINKTASSSYPAYASHGPGENRFCPKIRKDVNTFICRNHCLDGLIVDDHQVLCGEAIWRQSVMDKFSAEYRDKDGNVVGGYLEKRFEIHHDNGGHPALLKPGTRNSPIHEDAWSIEKRMTEMRKTEGKDRGYNTPADAKDLYNFDQHDLSKGPKNPQAFEKKKDGIAKLAITVSDSLLEKTAGDPRFKGVEWAEPEPQEGEEFFDNEDSKKKKKDEKWTPKKLDDKKEEKKAGFNFAKKKKKNKGHGGSSWLPYHIWKEQQDKDEDETESETESETEGESDSDSGSESSDSGSFGGDSGGGDGGSSTANSTWAIKTSGPDDVSRKPMKELEVVKAWGLDMSNVGGGGHIDQAMGENKNPGPKMKNCTKCNNNVRMDSNVCSCGNSQFKTMYESDIQSQTHSISSPDLHAHSDAEIIYANGIYRAIKAGKTTFGETPEEALDKLAAGLADYSPGTIDDISSNILDTREEMMQEIESPISNSEPVLDMAQIPESGEEMAINEPLPPPEILADPTPSTDGVPADAVSPIPQEIGPNSDGEVVSEFDLGPDEGHISSDHLDAHLAEEEAKRHPEDHFDIDTQAISSGAHPD
jgi:hypothetical protein